MSIPQEPEAEKTLVGASLMWPDKVALLGADLSPDAFYTPKLRAAWAAFRALDSRGVKPDVVNLLAEMPAGVMEPYELLELQVNCLPPNAGHVALVAKAAAGRALLTACARTLAEVQDGGADPYMQADSLAHLIAGLGAHTDEPQSVTYQEFRNMQTSGGEWIIPNIMKRDWHALITAPEGAGKAVLMRTLCAATAQGIHPFEHTDIPPMRTLLVDLENPVEAIQETGNVIDNTLLRRSRDYDPDRFRLWHYMRGFDLRRPEDRGQLRREIIFQRPDLVCMGPLYKMYVKRTGETYEQSALETINVLDDLRTTYGFALVLEHHAPKGKKSDRELAPMGSQLWSAWPELGIGLRPEDPDDPLNYNLIIEHWRRPRLKNKWPSEIHADRDWLISGVYF